MPDHGLPCDYGPVRYTGGRGCPAHCALEAVPGPPRQRPPGVSAWQDEPPPGRSQAAVDTPALEARISTLKPGNAGFRYRLRPGRAGAADTPRRSVRTPSGVTARPEQLDWSSD